LLIINKKLPKKGSGQSLSMNYYGLRVKQRESRRVEKKGGNSILVSARRIEPLNVDGRGACINWEKGSSWECIFVGSRGKF